MESTKVKEVKKYLIILLLPLLVACGSADKAPVSSSPSPKSKLKINIPSKCSESKVLQAVQQEIPGSKFIDTKWTPAADTELFDVLNNGGIACSFGIATAEIGSTVRWVEDSKMDYEKWIPKWEAQGYVKVNLAEFGVNDGYFLQKSQSDTQEFNIWILNFKSGGVWVSISRSAGASLAAGKNLIDAVISQ